MARLLQKIEWIKEKGGTERNIVKIYFNENYLGKVWPTMQQQSLEFYVYDLLSQPFVSKIKLKYSLAGNLRDFD